jgi:AcrR family transcriptional regulator
MSLNEVARPLRRDAAENRERVLAAAIQVFGDHGLDAGVDEVARVAGVGMGTLYRRFPSKQALIDELVGGLRRELRDLARSAATRTDGGGLEQLLLGTGELQAARPGCLQRLWAHSEADMDAIGEFRSLIPELVSDAQAHGRIRPEITSTDISMIMWSLSGLIETIGASAPSAWRRQLEISIAGMRPSSGGPFATVLTASPMSPAQFRKLTAPSR